MGTLGGNVCVDTRCNYYNQSYQWRKAVGFCMKKDGEICLVAPGQLALLGGVLVRYRARAVEPRRPRARWPARTASASIPITALYQDDGIEYLAKRPDEVLTDIRLPRAEGLRCDYLKLRRRGAFDFPSWAWRWR